MSKYDNKNSRTNRAKKGANRRRNFKKRNEEVKETELQDKDLGQGCENDFSWYNAYPQLAQDAGRISFFNPLGTDFDLADTSLSSTDPVSRVLKKQSSPGIMTLYFSPVFSKSSDFGSQLNIAARNLYSYLRSTNSGAKNFEPADLMMYLLAMDSAYTFYAWMVRTYGVLSLYSPTNKYYPNSVCRAINVDFENLQANMANFRGYINLFGAKLGKLCVPSQLSLTQRHQWMCSNIFVDSETPKAQSYIFQPDYYYVWEEMENSQGTQLLPVTLSYGSANGATLATIIQTGDQIIKGLMSSEDVGTISGDILRAYGESSIYKFGEIPEGYQCLPQYSEEVLMQIHNASILRPLDQSSVKITQDVTKQAIITNPKFTITFNEAKGSMENLFTASRILNVPTGKTEADVVFVSSRLTAIARVVDKSTSSGTVTVNCELTACGTEVITGITIHGRKNGAFSRMYLTQEMTIDTYGVTGLTAGQLISDYTAFKQAPAFYLDLNINDAKAASDFVRMQELDNFAILSETELARIHEVALLSELTMSASQWKK